MNILCVIENGTWIQSHVVGSLIDSGHTVHVFHYGAAVGEFYGYDRFREQLRKNNDLVEIAKRLFRTGGLDLIFCYAYDDFLLPETAKALARLDVPLVNYNVDMISQWYRQTRTARYFTRMLCAQRDNMKELARYNPRVLHFPMAGRKSTCNQGDMLDFDPAAPVTFVGTPMPYRISVLARLHCKGVPMAIYGKFWQEGKQATAPAGFEKTASDLWHYAWPKMRGEGSRGLARALRRRFSSGGAENADALPAGIMHGFLPEEKLGALFRNSDINLGFTRMTGDDPDVPGLTQVKLRDFEVPLAGGFYLVEFVPEYAEMFEPGKEIETWRTPAELADKIRYYLDHPEERRTIAAAGKRRAEAEHTWDRRFTALFADLGIG